MPAGIFIALFGYLLGSIPVGLVLSKLFTNIDPRRMGSKNIGATNVFRTAGKALGVLTLMGDLAKGLIPILMAIWWPVQDQWGLPKDFWISMVGFAPFLGHLFPIFLGFKGGKGVATALGIYLVISPIAVALEFILFSVLVWKWRFISLGSIACALTIPLLVAFFRSDSPFYFILSILIAALILYRHQSNIARLLQGTEHKWKV